MLTISFDAFDQQDIEAELEARGVRRSDPVVDALVRYEESGRVVPFESFIYWAHVDWDEFSATSHAQKEWKKKARQEDAKFSTTRQLKIGLLSPIECEACGKIVVPTWDGQKFCSIRCSASRFTRPSRTCLICNREFFGKTNTQTCSDKCANLLRSKSRSSPGGYRHDGKTLPLSEWSRMSGIGMATLVARLRRGWSLGRALSAAPKRTGRPKANIA